MKMNNPKRIKIIFLIILNTCIGISIGIGSTLAWEHYKKDLNNNDSIIAIIGKYDSTANKITTTKVIKDTVDVYDIIATYLQSETTNLIADRLKTRL
ncbi:hypothetical protein [Clostridium tetanomorphum]|uniref:hypothetical protein n=1 Tax=Clostridium tetanomorphum TaxID=1553 RepID=UPI0011BDA0E9|nr:hypothetical protein [Clostridium tetanomorphum]